MTETENALFAIRAAIDANTAAQREIAVAIERAAKTIARINLAAALCQTLVSDPKYVAGMTKGVVYAVWDATAPKEPNHAK